MQGFSFPGVYYAVRVISSAYNLKLIEFPSGFELYDFSGSVSGTPDPFEMDNVYGTAPQPLKLALSAILESLKVCRGNGRVGGAQPGPAAASCLVANHPALTAPSATTAVVQAMTSQAPAADRSPERSFGVPTRSLAVVLVVLMLHLAWRLSVILRRVGV